MKFKLLMVTLLTVHFSLFTAFGQSNRRTTQKSVPYRANYQRVASGNDSRHTLELRDGTLWAWGYNQYGAIGDNSTTNRTSPVQIGTDNDWVFIATGTRSSYAIKANGTLWAWGYNSVGQLGDGTLVDRHTPVQIGTDNKWIGISANEWTAIGLKTDGTIWSWGHNNFGQLGDGTTTDHSSPAQIGSGTTWTKIASAFDGSFALQANGTLWSWGRNNYGTLGIGSTTNQLSPVQIGTDNDWASFGTGAYHVAAIKSNGTLWTWGYNVDGELGDGTTTQQNSPVQIGTANNWVSVAPGGYCTLATKANGTLWAWGGNANGELGNGNTTNVLAPAQVGTDNHWVMAAAGSHHSMGVKVDGTLWTWGQNLYGEFGNGTIGDQHSPVQTSITLNVWLTVASSGYHNLAIKTNGRMLGWGGDVYGEIMQPSSVSYLFVQYLGSENNWISVAAGIYHSLGIKSDGTLWAWGSNQFGQLGIGTTDMNFNNVPIQVGTDNTWVSISACAFNSMGLKADGTIWTWGKNQLGQLGIGNLIDQSAPVQVGTLHTWVSIGAGQFSTFALKADGTRWGWGTNNLNQLGDGTTTQRTSPVQTSTNNDWITCQSGPGQHTVALKANGTLWAWGYNSDGQLGNNTIVNNQNILQVGTDNKWIGYAVGFSHTMGLKTDGTVWGWGDNIGGQLGDGTTTDRHLPVQIASVSNCIRVNVGDNHSVIMKALRDGFCATGQNNYGQVGDNTNVQRNNFTCYIEGCAAPAAPTASGVTICEGNTASLTAIGAGTVSWYSAATGGTLITTGSSYTTPVLTTDTTFYAQDFTCAVSSTRRAVTVTVNPNYSINASASICPGDTYTFPDATTSTTATVNTSHLTSATSCDSSIVTTLTINPTYSSNVSASICQGNTYTFPDATTSTTATVHTSHFSTVNTCDSAIVTTLTINQVYSSNVSASICPGDTYTFPDATTATTATVHTSHFSTVNTCDSAIVTTLTINPTYSSNASASICPGDTYTFPDATTATTATVHTSHLSAFNSCDSAIVTTLTVNPTYTSNASASICTGDTYTFPDNTTATTATVHTSHLSTINTCDSAIVTTLTINPTYSSNVSASICMGDTYTFPDNTTATTATVHTSHFSTINTCDSAVVTTLTVNSLPTITVASGATVFCANSGNTALVGIPSGGNWSGAGVSGNTFSPSLSGAGTFSAIYTFTNGNGCSNSDSVVMTVNALPSISVAAADTLFCANDANESLLALPSGGSWSGTGITGTSFSPSLAGAGAHVITYSFTDANTCTNTASLTMTVHPLPVVTLDFGSIGLYYICSNFTPWTVLGGGSPAGGIWSGMGVSNDTVFSAGIPIAIYYTYTYSYTDINTCSNSDNDSIVFDLCMGMQELNSNDEITIYPNPSSGVFQVSSSKFQVQSIKVMNLLGETVYQSEIVNSKSEISVDLSGESKGIYFIEITTINGNRFNQKIIIE